MQNGKFLAIQCRISRGGFSSERVFRVKLMGGAEHIAAAPVEYFLTERLGPLPADQPEKRGELIPGFVTGRLIRDEVGSQLVSVPSGEVLLLPASEIREYPNERAAHVPVQS